MQTEYELRVLNINIKEIIEKCEFLNATKIGCFHQKRFVYDFNPPIKGKWIRLRNDGTNSTLAIKKIESLTLDGTKELEIIVSDFFSTSEILKELGYSFRIYQENFRIEYCLNNVKIDIDKWPMLEPYIEFEGESENDIQQAIELLRIDKRRITFDGVDNIYSKKGINLESIKELTFNSNENKYISKIKMILED